MVIIGFGLFKWALALIQSVHEANKANKRMTRRIPNANANLEGERQSKSLSLSSSSSILTSSLIMEEALILSAMTS